MTHVALIPWECDQCGRVSTDEPHFPHDPDCVDHDDCDCDNNVCPDCCWSTDCHKELP